MDKFDGGGTMAAVRCFVSYAGPDREWAFWIGQHLRSAGFEVELDEWSWDVGTSFVRNIERALADADRVIAVCSPHYFDAGSYGMEEREAALRLAHSRAGLLVPVLVALCELPPLIAVLSRINLVGLNEQEASAKLLAKMVGVAAPPLAYKPRWPGSRAAGNALPMMTSRGHSVVGGERIWNVPKRLFRFTDRIEILRDLSIAFKALDVPAAVAIFGMGGVGKSQLAIEYAWRNAERYDVVWWVHAEQETQVPAQLAALLERMGTHSSGSATQDAAMVLTMLQSSNKPWLLIFDNATAAERLQKWIPRGVCGHVLLTSRNPDWGSVAETFELQVLALADAAAYVRTRVERTAPDTAMALASEVGCLPLALEQLSAYVEHAGVEPLVFLNRFRERREHFLRRGIDLHYGGSMDTAWSLALENLQDNAPASAQLVTLLALFGPEPVPLSIFTENPRELPEPLRWSVLSERSDHLDFDDVIAEALSLSLLRRDRDTVVVHRVVQDVVRARLSDHECAAAARNVRALVAAFLSGWKPERPESWQIWEAVDPHIASAPALAADPGRVAAEPAARRVLLDACRYRWARGAYAGAKELVEVILVCWKQQLAADHAEVLEAELYLAGACYDLGDYASAYAMAEGLATRTTTVLGPDDPLTLTAASCLARCLRGYARYDEAIELNESILERRTRVLGDDDPETVATACSLGRSLAGAGRLREAAEVDRRSVEIRSTSLGRRHPDTLVAVNSLVGDLLFLGVLDEARALGEENLDALRDVLGESHPDTLNAAYIFSGVLAEMGEFHAAMALDTDTFQRCRSVFGDTHPNTLHVRTNLATDSGGLGDHLTAMTADRELLQLYRGLLSDKDPATFAVANNLLMDLVALDDMAAVVSLRSEFPELQGVRRKRDWWFSRVL